MYSLESTAATSESANTAVFFKLANYVSDYYMLRATCGQAASSPHIESISNKRGSHHKGTQQQQSHGYSLLDLNLHVSSEATPSHTSTQAVPVTWRLGNDSCSGSASASLGCFCFQSGNIHELPGYRLNLFAVGVSRCREISVSSRTMDIAP